jgi:outer membrane receptor for ferrienterochelin and colicin
VFDIISAGADSPGSDILRFQNSSTPVTLAGVETELRREFRRQWMLSISYGYQQAQYDDPSLADAALVNAPSHLFAFKGIAPLIEDVALLGLRVSYEAPRRISLDGPGTTDAALYIDATLSGTVKQFGLHYTFGVYNLADQQTAVPVSSAYLSRVMPQNGRTILFNVSANLP